MVNTIHLSLALEIKCSVLNEKSPSHLWEKLEKIYVSKSFTNMLYLKKQLFELKIDEEMDIGDHINKFNKCVTQLLSVEVKIDKEDQVIILFASLPKSYETVVTMLLVGKTTLIVDKVSTTLLEIENVKKSSSLSHTRQALNELWTMSWQE